MKKFRKIAAVLLCVVMIAASLQCLAFAAPQDSGKLNFLVLGDSIAEGFGVENKEDAAYGKIVADTNGYNYRNLAQVANDTQDLIRKIETVDEFRESIAWADVINICIGSNNYLASKDVVWITIGALFGTNDKKLDEIAYGIYDDLNTIYSLIREINPDATLIFDNIYCAWKGLGHIPFIKAVSRINLCSINSPQSTTMSLYLTQARSSRITPSFWRTTASIRTQRAMSSLQGIC